MECVLLHWTTWVPAATATFGALSHPIQAKLKIIGSISFRLLMPHLKFLGKAIIPTLKITQAVLGIGMAISGIGIAFDLAVGGKALYNLA